MAIILPDRVESNNPQEYGIVKASHVTGHRSVQNLTELYSLSDAILSDSKNNTNNDAIGQEWWVRDESAYYRLVNWQQRRSSSGWDKKEELQWIILS